MAFPLRQSTASQEIPLGPFVSSTDGDTAKTGLTIAASDILIWVEGGTTEAAKTSGGATHIAGGRYYAVLDATDTATLGKMRVSVHVATALPVWLDCVVYPANVYDSLVLGSDLLDANVAQVLGAAATTSDGTAQAGSTTSVTLASGASSVDDYYNGQTIAIVSGTSIGQRRTIVNYVGSTKVATVHRPWATNPDSTSAYIFEPGIDFLGTCGTVNDASATTTGFVTTLTGYGDDFFKGAFIVFIDGAMRGESRKISGYTSATGAVALATATIGTIANGSPFVILGRSE